LSDWKELRLKTGSKENKNPLSKSESGEAKKPIIISHPPAANQSVSPTFIP
jgi:hypothetical protein